MGIQEIIVLIAVLLAVVYLGWHFRRRHKRKTGCPSCKLMQAAQSPPARNARQMADKRQ